MTDENRYVMATVDATTEAGRLGLLEQRFDPGTIRRLDQLGVSSGWRCLEVGAGHGSIVRWLADRVGAGGSVVAADIDPRFLTGLPDNVEVRTFDVREDQIEGVFDVVHCRALLMHLPDPAGAVARMVGALRPGGILLAEEGDYGLLHFAGHPDEQAVNAANERFHRAMGEAGIMDSYFGHKLPAILLAHGLELQLTEIETMIGQRGELEYEWTRATWLAAGPKLLAGGVIDEATWNACEGFFSSGGDVLIGVSLVAAGGRKPG
jgi:SAM-dependent methyltransferase